MRQLLLSAHVLAAIVLTVVAAVLLAAVVLPAQQRAMALLDSEPEKEWRR